MLMEHILRLYLTSVFTKKISGNSNRCPHRTSSHKADVPVLKKYRPISVTTTFAEIFERLLINQLGLEDG